MSNNIPTISAKNIVYKSKNPSFWFGADYNMNIYKGCSHGCIYCDSRSTCYQNTDFDTVKVKENALEKVRNDLRRKVKTGVVGTGAMSDPYNSFEKRFELTRNSLELINAYGFGTAIDTKSPLVARDVDILRDIKSHSPVIVKMTITTADSTLCRKLEPNVSDSIRRFEALEKLSSAGIFCGVLMMPILPFINDTEENIIQILQNAKHSGARFVYPSMGMTLREGNREYYYEKLDELFPGTKQKYIQTYGNNYVCNSKKAKQLWNIFRENCERLGLMYNMNAITQSYKMGYGDRQLSFF